MPRLEAHRAFASGLHGRLCVGGGGCKGKAPSSLSLSIDELLLHIEVSEGMSGCIWVGESTRIDVVCNVIVNAQRVDRKSIHKEDE